MVVCSFVFETVQKPLGYVSFCFLLLVWVVGIEVVSKVLYLLLQVAVGNIVLCDCVDTWMWNGIEIV